MHEISDDDDEPPVAAARSARPAATGTRANPFVFSSDEDDVDENDLPARRRRRPPPPRASAAAAPPPPTTPSRSARRRAWAPGPRPHAVPSTPRTPRVSRPAQRGSGSGSGSGHRRRVEPKGIYLGSWRGSGLPANVSNAVYGSRDVFNRINRRISKEDNQGHIIWGGSFSSHTTACSHKMIQYITRFAGMTKAEVDSHIQPLLDQQAHCAIQPITLTPVLQLSWIDLTV